MSEWLAMGGHGFYIWSAYGMLAAAVIVELWSLRRRRQAAWRHVDEARDEYLQGGGPGQGRRHPEPKTHQAEHEPRTR